MADPNSASFITVTSANQFDNQSDFEARVLSSILQVQAYHEFEFTDVPLHWAEALQQDIDEKIPSRKTYNIRSSSLRMRCMSIFDLDCIQPWLFDQPMDWLESGDITPHEKSLLRTQVGTRTGWSESTRQLHDDVNLLLAGGNGEIKVVVILKCTRLPGDRVAGTVELFKRDHQGMPRREQIETVFPRHLDANPQRLTIQREDLFGSALLPGHRGVLYLDVERFRDYATQDLGLMGLEPA